MEVSGFKAVISKAKVRRLENHGRGQASAPRPELAPIPKAIVANKPGISGGNSMSLRLPAGLPEGVTQKALDAFIASCSDAQWFTGKGRTIEKTSIAERARIDIEGAHYELALIKCEYEGGESDLFHVPLVIGDDGSLADALLDPTFVRAMVACVRDNKHIRASSGVVRGELTKGKTLPSDLDDAVVKPLGVPQSNVSIKVGNDVLLKAYRKPEAGTPIEREVTAHLTAQHYKNTPQLLGTITMDTKQGPMTIGMLFELVTSDGDGWKTTLDSLSKGADPVSLAKGIALLGTRIGEMHQALGGSKLSPETPASSRPTTHQDPAFAPQEITKEDLSTWRNTIARELDDTIAKARAKDPAIAKKLTNAKPHLLARLDELNKIDPSGMKTRIHGDLHLGQVLRRDGDWMVLDFEGEPARSKEERRGFYTPLRDVAGMLRSFHYAEAEAGAPKGWARQAGESFLDAYKRAVSSTDLMPTDDHAFKVILAAVELEKALYEVRYELKSRPHMVEIPLSRVLEMAQ
jgi:maltokinase